MKNFKLLLIGMLLAFTGSLQAQVTSVDYQMKYDTSTCNYNCYLIVNAGTAVTQQQRTQFNAQYSIIVPTGTDLTLVESIFPLVDNTNLDGTTPMDWSLGSPLVAPAAQPESDFYSITPTLNPTSRYNVLNPGDTVHLFTLAVDTVFNCSEGIRIFDNDSDPQSNEDGMEGLDYNNGFTIGNTLQRYNANSEQLFPPAPTIISLDVACSDGIEVNLTATTSDCQGPLAYEWSGPESYSSTSEDVMIPVTTSANNGYYVVTITDAFGCTTVDSVFATSKPEGSGPAEMCAGTQDTLFGVPSTGTWSASGANPFGATLSPIAPGQVIVEFSDFATATDYDFYYSIPGCSDTISISVNPMPSVINPGDAELCIGEQQIVFSGSVGTWTSDNPGVASIATSGGITTVTAVSPGVANMIFIDDNTGCPAELPFTVNPAPIVTNAGTDSICVGSTTDLNGPGAGSWVSTDAAIFTIDGVSGVVTGVSEGVAAALFTSGSTGCVSDSFFITVVPVPVAVVAEDSICVFGTTQLEPSGAGGTWTSSHPLVANITNTGLVTGLSVGTATFTYTSLSTGCVSAESDTVWVTPAPVVDLDQTEACIGETITLSPTVGGTWVSGDNEVATVTANGTVTTVAQGPVIFYFTSDATGCTAPTETLVVHPNPPTSASSDTICISSTATLTGTGAGSWAAVHPAIAALQGSNTALGLSEGDAAFLFTSDGTGCVSDTLWINVKPRPTVVVNDNLICTGEQTTLDSGGEAGTWESSNPGIAAIDNDGVVTGLTAGAAVFTFTSLSSGCASDPSDPILVIASPVVSVDVEGLCIGSTGQATQIGAAGGSWSSSSDAIATIDAVTGEITGVSPGFVTFVFTAAGTGCPSPPTDAIEIYSPPNVDFSGESTICPGAMTAVTAPGEGTWLSTDTDVAIIDFDGNVTGVAEGTAYLVFTLTSNGCQSDSLELTVSADPVVYVDGPTELCIGATTTLFPASGGTWSSNHPTIASVDPDGNVIALAQGSATFNFISDAGCGSGDTNPIIINGGPVVTVDDTEMCISDTIQIEPSTGGTWVSNAPGVASIDDTGQVIALTSGTVTFTYTDTTTLCVSDESPEVTVHEPITPTYNGPDSVCVGETGIQYFPSTDGTWSSSDESIAIITNTGAVSALAPGKVVFFYTPLANGCISNPTDSLTITPGPDISITGDDEICIGETTTLAPDTPQTGTWVSNHPDVASIDDNGLVTGLSAGQATFTFSSDVTGCSSIESDPVIVHGPPTVYIDGSDITCIGGTTQLFPSSGGIWASLNPGVASVDPVTGLVTGISEGTATFVWTSDDTDCPSEPTNPVTVTESPDAEITGEDEICINAQTTLSPTSGGSWTSSNDLIATVADDGVVTAHAPGVVTFTFTEGASGCVGTISTPPVTVSQCIDPDFNATYVDVEVSGDASTNDDVPVGSTYGTSPLNTGKPIGSVFTLTMNSDGTYTFVGNLVGVYTFEVPVCIPPKVAGCETATLTITVVDFAEPVGAPVANVDYATTAINTPVDLISLSNDKCVLATGCDLDPAITILSNPSNGGVTVDNATGNTTYTPAAGFVGTDTLRYQVCVVAEPTNCSAAYQIITINHGTAENTTTAADDFNVAMQDSTVYGDVSLNDTDAEGDNQTINGYSSTVAAGTLNLNNDGTYDFTPAPGFYGPVDFPYTTCDDNATQACADATLHILVMRDLYIYVRVYLEGSLRENGGEIGTTHTRPLMRDQLRVSPFTNPQNTEGRYIPDVDPYKNEQPRHNLTSYFEHSAPGDRLAFNEIPDPASVFAVEGEDAIVDWVFIELRSKLDSANVVATRTGLVQRDGDVADLNGEFGLRFPGIILDDYFVSVRHRNHLGAMTASRQSPAQLYDLVDFTLEETGIFDFGLTFDGIYDYTGLAQNALLEPGYLCLWAGNMSHETYIKPGSPDTIGTTLIKFNNPNDDLNEAFSDVFGYEYLDTGGSTVYNFFTNFDFAYGYHPGDYDMNSKTKFDNPFDDKNMLYSQLLFYPLNTAFTDNFNHFIQQLPYYDNVVR